MQNVLFRSLTLAGASLAIALASTSGAYAQSGSTFLIQLGQHSSQDAARSQWDMLQKRYPDQLGGLSLRVAPVRSQGKEVFRTQAAGIASYAQAQSVCSELSAASVTCSVVETSIYQPEDDTVAVAMPTQKPAAPQPAMAAVNEIAVQETAIAAAPASSAPPAAETPAAEIEDNRSFGEKYLPWLGFGKKKEEQPTEQKPVQQIASAPVEDASPISAAPTEWQPTEIPAQGTAPRAEGHAATQALMDNQRATKTAASATPTAAELTARAPRNLNAHTAPAEQFAALPVEPQTADVESVNVSAQVDVAEAVQVPLSNDGGGTRVMLTNKPVGYGGFPSQPVAANSNELWAQIGQFSTKENAFAFSRELARQYPDLLQFTRIRVVSPFDSRRMGARSDVASMRLGPFKDNAQINRICGIARESRLNCSVVREVGTASSARGATASRQRYNPQEAQARRVAVNRGYSRTPGNIPTGAYWVQLGAFDTTGGAQQRWSELQNTHKELFRSLKPQISYPALSSASAPVYHLRTGPFVDRTGAFDLCGKLQARRLNCVVVQSR